MRRFWWVGAIIFVAAFVPYLVGSGWMTSMSVKGALAHARRQVEIEPVLTDLGKAQSALEAHRSRVESLSAILKNATGFTPDIGDTIPGGFGSAEWKAIVDYLNGADLDTALKAAADVQAEALK